METMTDVASESHPDPIPNPHHRKIELQSPLDLTYLQSHTAAAARQKLDLHFPPNASQVAAAADGNGTASDPMRERVQELVAQFLARTWGAAKMGITVNGADADAAADAEVMGGGDEEGKKREEKEGVDFEYETYDSQLSGRVAGLHAELEALTTQVSRLRRTAPGDAARGFGDVLLAGLKGEENESDEGGLRRMVEGEEPLPGLRLQDVREGWAGDVADVYEKGVAELRRLGGHGGSGGGSGGEGSGSLTETRGRLERARVAAVELE